MTSSTLPRFGCCAGIDRADAVAQSGYDFIELPAATVLQGEADGSEFAPMLDRLEHLPLPAEAFNIFLPGGMKIVGEEVDRERIHRYLKHVMDRASAVGGKLIVFGSGGARRVPDGFDPLEAQAQIAEFLHEAGAEAERYGITLAIEPLNRGESNILNSVPEALDMAEQADHPSVQVLADLYHMEKDGEPLDHILQAKGRLTHVHVADTGRFAPGTGDADTAGLFRRLKEIGYAGRISIECSWKNFEEEAPVSLEFLKRTWAEA